MRPKMIPFIVCSLILAVSLPAFALDVEEVFVGVVEDREQDANLVYVFVVSLAGEDIAGGRVRRPGNPTPICELVDDAVYLGFDATCNILGSSIADFCSQFGFGDFEIEIDAAVGGDDSVTVNFDPGCTDPFPGNVDITAPATGASVPPIPGPNELCYDCTVPGGCGDRWLMELSDEFGDIDTGEFLEQPPVPGCWDPGVCLSQQDNYEWRATSLHIFLDEAPTATDLGDAFKQTQFFQNANLDFFDVDTPAPTTPSAIPAGVGGAFPVFAIKQTVDGSVLDIIWDEAACCGNTETHLIHGTRADLPSMPGASFTLDGSQCAIGTDGVFTWNSVPTPAAGDFVWWLVLAGDGAGTEGSWGVDSSDQERVGPGGGGSSGQCGTTARTLANVCGR